MSPITFKKFQSLARDHNLITLQQELAVDTETPVSIFQRFRDEPYSFLFESIEGEERWARYTFIGFRPIELFRSLDKRVEWKGRQGGWKKKSSSDPLRELEKRLRRYHPAEVEGLRFSAGAVGYLAYDMVRFIEKLPAGKKPRTDPWDSFFMIPQVLLIFDNREHTLRILYHVPIGKKAELRGCYEESVAALKKIRQALSQPLPERSRRRQAQKQKRSFRALWNQRAYRSAVRKIKEYVRAGDCIQTVISLRLQAPFHADSFDVYRALRRLNPSPYMFYLHLDDHDVVGASPETMVQLEGDQLTLRPIAGTRPRGKTEAADRILETELLADPKERAEHIMLVDLGRNDLGRVAEKESVEVNELMVIERYSHVMHIVSNVRATLATGKGPFDVLRATFPAGTLSGAPKVRAMEIIDSLEPTRRGIYGGCIGYVDFSGNLDTAIAIRTAVICDHIVSVQAGAGIVADSDPEREYQECMSKARGVLKAVEMAEKGL